jgi:diaminopimelate decarboxylase
VVNREKLAGRFGTPLYVYDAGAIRERFRKLKRAFASRSPLICYALKANTNGAICRLLAREGAGADIVSGGELRRALAAGFRADRIVFSGIGKTVEELELALRAGVLTINVESRAELSAIEAVARRLKRAAPISVRLNPNVDAGTHPHITTGLAYNKFGVEEKEAAGLLARAEAHPWLKAKGIQCHIGSQIGSAAPYAKAAKAVERLAKGRGLELVDLGGGFGVEGDFPVAALARLLKGVVPSARLLLEPGRYLVADAGTLLTRVLYKKATSKRRFVIVDAAMNDLMRPALYGAEHPIAAVKPRKGPREKVDVVGPVCETGDFLARQRSLPPLLPGDLLAVGQAGAYGFSMSSQYNSRPRAAEILVDGGQARLVRRRETWKDLVRHEL